jgi:hypothetical protein
MLSQLTQRKQLPADVPALTIRHAAAGDAERIDRLAQLDSSRAPGGDLLVAEVGGELWAALSLDDGHAVADPLRPSSEAVWMLAERSRQLHRARRPRRARMRLRFA